MTRPRTGASNYTLTILTALNTILLIVLIVWVNHIYQLSLIVP